MSLTAEKEVSVAESEGSVDHHHNCQLFCDHLPRTCAFNAHDSCYSGMNEPFSVSQCIGRFCLPIASACWPHTPRQHLLGCISHVVHLSMCFELAGLCDIVALQGAMVNELFKLAEKSQKEQTKPAGQGRLQQWYFFMVAAFWMYFRHAHQAHPRKSMVFSGR